MEEWNEHIEEIIQNKSFEDLTPEDINTLGEIASDAKSYESYRQLLNNVIPAMKEERIQPSPDLDQKIKSIAEKEKNKGGGYFNWVKFAAAAAILIGVFSVSYWFIENNKVEQESKVAQAKKKEKMSDKEEELKAGEADTKFADSSVISGRKEVSPSESIAEEKNKLNSQDQLEKELKQEKDMTKSSNSEAISEEFKVVEDEKNDLRSRDKNQLNNFETLESADEEVALTAPSVEGAIRESKDKNKRTVDLDDASVQSDLFSTTAKAERSNSGGVYGNAPKEDDVRDDIVGTIELAKPASSQEDAFELLTIAF